MVAMQLDTETMLLPEHQNEIEILTKMEHEHVIGYHGSFINRVGRWPALHIITDYADGKEASSHVRQCSLCRQHAKCPGAGGTLEDVIKAQKGVFFLREVSLMALGRC